MNPRDNYDHLDYAEGMYDLLKEEARRNKEAAELREAAMKANLEESKRRTQAANEAYNALCDVLGVDDLSAGIDGGGSHIRIPIDSINTMVARIAALRSNALEDGVL